MKNTIQAAWAQLEDGMPPEISEDQRNDLRLVFYFGANSILSIISDCVENRVSGRGMNEIFRGLSGEIFELMEEVSARQIREFTNRLEAFKQSQRSTKQ